MFVILKIMLTLFNSFDFSNIPYICVGDFFMIENEISGANETYDSTDVCPTKFDLLECC